MIRTVVFLALASFGGFVWFDPGLIGLTVRRIEITGCRFISSDSISVIADRFVGKDLSVSTCRSLETAVGTHPLVSGSTAERSVDGSIILHLEERRILAMVDDGDGIGIDEQGISHSIEISPDSLPRVQGWVDNDPFWMSAICLFDRVYAGNPSILRRSIIRVEPAVSAAIVDIAQFPDVELWLPCPPDEHLESRIEYISHVMADARSREADPITIDLRWRNQIVVTPRNVSGGRT